MEFLLTHPVWDVTETCISPFFFKTFLLTHPVWDVTYFARMVKEKKLISTHTSRVGCDAVVGYSGFVYYISTHTSRVGCDHPVVKSYFVLKHFYSHIPCGM